MTTITVYTTDSAPEAAKQGLKPTKAAFWVVPNLEATMSVLLVRDHDVAEHGIAISGLIGAAGAFSVLRAASSPMAVSAGSALPLRSRRWRPPSPSPLGQQ